MKLIALLIALHATLFAVNPFEGALKVIPEWITEQIEEDFRGIASSDLSDEVLRQALQLNHDGLIYYKIHNGELSLLGATQGTLNKEEKFSPDPSLIDLLNGGRFTIFTYYLKKLMKLCQEHALPLPDSQFLLCIGDGPLDGVTAPCFCFSKKRDYPKAILVPDTICLYHGKTLILRVDHGIKKHPWANKVNQAFWRGVNTGYSIAPDYSQLPRLLLVQESLKHPDLIDARFNKLVGETELMKEFFSPYMGDDKRISDHLKYKYQILVDGNTCSWPRAYWQLFSNSVIFKQNSDYIQWYYKGLHPYEHYIPVAADFHDLADQIKWVRVDDPFALQVSQNANCFAKENLSHLDMLYYIYLVLCKYGTVQNEI